MQLLIRQLVTVALLALGVTHAAAQVETYPAKPIRLVVPYPPGGGTDVIARILQEPLSQALGQQVIIDNKGGAGGAVGTDIVAKASPDGYTLLFTLSSHTINPSVFKVNYDTERDFEPVTLAASLPQLIFASPKAPFNTLAEMISYSRKNIGKLSFASVGNGSPSHIAGELLKQATGTYMVHIPYRGGGPAVQDVIAGQLELGIVSIPAAAAQAKAGRVKPLAVTTKERNPSFPDVPTVAEALNLKNYEVDSWYAMFAPQGTPPAITQRLQAEIAKIVKRPNIQEKLLLQGAVGVGSTSQALQAVVKKELVQWKSLVRERGIKPD